MKIALVGPLPPPSAGMANQCEQLSRLLRREGIEVIAIQTNTQYRPAWIARIRGVRAAFRLVRYVVFLWRNAGTADVIHIFANSGWAWYLFALPALMVARLRRLPSIVNYRGGDAERFFNSVPRWARKTLRWPDSLIVPSQFLYEVFQKFQAPCAVIPNIVDLQRFPFRPPAEASRGTHIIVTRNLEPIYGLDTAIRAFSLVRKRISDARMTIAGSGPELNRLELLTASLGVADAVSFAGRIENSRIHELYRTADVLLNPSLVDNMPISLLEAFAAGVPVVSTCVGGVPFIADDGKTALLVSPADPDSMAQALFKILDDRALALALSNAARTKAEECSWERVKEQWIVEYSRVMRKSDRPSGRSTLTETNAGRGSEPN